MFENMSIAQVKEHIKEVKFEEYLEYIDILRKDGRKGVQKLAEGLAKKLDRARHEKERIEWLKRNEYALLERGYTAVGGIDEAGRGPLAGPVYAAVVIFDKDVFIDGINDSKKISEKKRELLFEEIREKAVDYSIGFADHSEIDSYNILNATKLAIKRAVEGLNVKPDYLLIDALKLPEVDVPQRSIIQGDANSISIAAASILAKVSRDRVMLEYHKKYPEYGFEKHKGYGTKEHYEAIQKHGITDIHRMSFLKSIMGKR